MQHRNRRSTRGATPGAPARGKFELRDCFFSGDPLEVVAPSHEVRVGCDTGDLPAFRAMAHANLGGLSRNLELNGSTEAATSDHWLTSRILDSRRRRPVALRTPAIAAAQYRPAAARWTSIHRVALVRRLIFSPRCLCKTRAFVCRLAISSNSK